MNFKVWLDRGVFLGGQFHPRESVFRADPEIEELRELLEKGFVSRYEEPDRRPARGETFTVIPALPGTGKQK